MAECLLEVSGLYGAQTMNRVTVAVCWQRQSLKDPLNVPPLSKYMRLWHQQSQTEGKQKPSWSLWGQFMAINFKNTRESSSPSGKLPFQRDVGKVGD